MIEPRNIVDGIFDLLISQVREGNLPADPEYFEKLRESFSLRVAEFPETFEPGYGEVD